MKTIRRSEERGHAQHGWLESFHSFSFANYYDPRHMHFRRLRVINEDFVAPGRGFAPHPHENMEIVTYVISGQLEHKDSMGNGSVIRSGDVQYMSAGTGVTHSEFNPSKTEPVHLLQIWILPDESGTQPRYAQQNFPATEKRDRLRLVASPDGADGSLAIRSDTRLYAAVLSKGRTLDYSASPGRQAWIQVVRGELVVDGESLRAGDALAMTADDAAKHSEFHAPGGDVEFLLFDLA